MDPNVQRALQAKWDDDEYKKKAEQKKRIAPSRLAKELDCELNEFEVFRKTHTRKDDQGQKMWVDNRSKGIVVFERLSIEAFSASIGSDSSSSTTVDEYHIFYQAISGRNKEGRVYGLGSQANQSYPVASGSTSSSLYGSMSHDLEEMRLRFT
ncbi:uncharacterized protein LOC127788179 [Diospyros lotus]|uniref:uncharacterized protein LOC127788179 n=1 Tax=Diospyros lotus TaxID=55363 RepID=UPI00225A4B6E|nr:uncharacterized protein LOC127788179 [Diospyros lotus]